MTAKPICVIKVDLGRLSPKPDVSDFLPEFGKACIDKMPDYHVFVIPQDDFEDSHDVLEFQVFYEKDFTELQYQELKKIIEDSLPAQKPNC
jgi:hypothetical protein